MPAGCWVLAAAWEAGTVEFRLQKERDERNMWPGVTPRVLVSCIGRGAGCLLPVGLLGFRLDNCFQGCTRVDLRGAHTVEMSCYVKIFFVNPVSCAPGWMY
jgi:hypothetical protein